MNKKNLESWFEENDSSELLYQSNMDMSETAHESDSLNLKNSDIVRIEEKVNVNWHGVQGCNDRSRAEGEWKKALENWAKNKMFEHRNWRWVSYGIIEGSARCSFSRDILTGVRSCLCRGYMKCYFEFRKP